MLHYRANKWVYKGMQKLSLVTLWSLTLSGNEFKVDGPATEKARRPYRTFATGDAEEPGVIDWRI